jgi:glycosyltransferase involved in cell wall biosynthesis
MGNETARIKTVVHLLPHPGGGGETYVDLLSRMDGYRFERVMLLPEQGRERRLADAIRLVPRAGLGALRHADLLHVHGEGASALALAALAARRSVVTLHGLNVLRRSSGVKRRAAEVNLRLIVRAATRTICVAESERDEVLEVAGKRVAPRLAVIHNGVELLMAPGEKERAAARALYGLPSEAVVGIYSGSLHPHKDPLAAARAAVEVAQGGAPIVLLIAGEGPLLPELEQLAASSGHATLRLIGQQEEMLPVLAAADFFVLPSLREGFSFSLLEAMSLGLAVVVSDAPGNLEAVGDAGLVVRRGDVEGHAAAFRRVLEDTAGRVALGERARERVAQRFTADEMVRRTRAVYEQVLGVPGAGSLAAEDQATEPKIAPSAPNGGTAPSETAA